MNNPFINRESELGRLQELYRAPASSLVVIYGRRRLGKTRLVREFARQLPHVYYMADRGSDLDARRSVAMVMAESIGEATLASAESAATACADYVRTH